MKIYHQYICDDDVGEVEGMFSIAGRCIGWWFNDDANWRNEYFAPFMRELGIEVIETTKFADKLKEATK